ncbi:MAG TPA: gamma-glutamylcyclotransferase family protein [Pyrinomonadaceae bacterium]|nr:gamma-glutamylcyclotransferase family protein [Pyrinomonadaceae bacterium]
MNIADAESENLFTYGTLQQEEVQLATFGRRLEGRPDVLPGYRLIMTEVRDRSFATANGALQRTVEFTGITSDFAAGVVLVVTRAELEQSDAYEPTDYERRRIELKSGAEAWVYLQKAMR